tara:strand:+ start:242 stop:406 length:165 start_codon:yes stop_codon:yes gene_type:complete
MVALVRRDPTLARERLPKLFADSAELTLIQGCIAERLTVGEVARRLLGTPSLLD